MDCFPSPYHHHHHRSRTKSSSRSVRRDENSVPVEPLQISIDCVQSPPATTANPSSRSPLSLLRSPTSSLPLRELLLLSPSSSRRSKARFDDEAPEAAGMRRRCKNVAASPRSSRRWRREEKEVGPVEEAVKQKKRRHSGRHRKERLSLVPFQPPSTSSLTDEENGGDLDRVGALITDLIMWRDVSKSTLWFGFGCLCFLSSCFTKGINVSIFSAISRLAILLLGVSFFSNSVFQRNQIEKRSFAKLKEDDILHLAKLILPALNFAISKTRELFSGEPSMTLRVAPFLLLGAEYGHLITMWRLCAIGFFVSFSVPKLYSCYSAQINQRVECLKLRLLDTWSVCTHKKKVLASVLVTFWNLSTIKTRICTAFILLVILRYFRQDIMENVEADEVAEKEQHQALVVVAEPEQEEHRHALVVAERKHQC
ncbi:reticulon-like protein B18 isoform X2 [Vigna radiata var. radiata]|uniref:Reticulon-like protein n=1 Tax=Vigna radiata var. radiata TaxID=3916 RepID=A0A1S3THN6_VIGRR|nr:reticulon-like protein B18 isoform X2 [Vigna radiata var. radiata]